MNQRHYSISILSGIGQPPASVTQKVSREVAMPLMDALGAAGIRASLTIGEPSISSTPDVDEAPVKRSGRVMRPLVLAHFIRDAHAELAVGESKILNFHDFGSGSFPSFKKSVYQQANKTFGAGRYSTSSNKRNKTVVLTKKNFNGQEKS